MCTHQVLKIDWGKSLCIFARTESRHRSLFPLPSISERGESLHSTSIWPEVFIEFLFTFPKKSSRENFNSKNCTQNVHERLLTDKFQTENIAVILSWIWFKVARKSNKNQQETNLRRNFSFRQRKKIWELWKCLRWHTVARWRATNCSLRWPRPAAHPGAVSFNFSHRIKSTHTNFSSLVCVSLKIFAGVFLIPAGF